MLVRSCMILLIVFFPLVLSSCTNCSPEQERCCGTLRRRCCTLAEFEAEASSSGVLKKAVQNVTDKFDQKKTQIKDSLAKNKQKIQGAKDAVKKNKQRIQDAKETLDTLKQGKEAAKGMGTVLKIVIGVLVGFVVLFVVVLVACCLLPCCLVAKLRNKNKKNLNQENIEMDVKEGPSSPTEDQQLVQ